MHLFWCYGVRVLNILAVLGTRNRGEHRKPNEEEEGGGFRAKIRVTAQTLVSPVPRKGI